MKSKCSIILLSFLLVACNDDKTKSIYSQKHTINKYDMKRPANSRLVQSYDGTIVEIQEISVQEAKSLILEKCGKNVSSPEPLTYDVFQLDNGNVVTISDKYATVYNNLTDLQKFIEDDKGDAEKQKFGPVNRHILKNQNPFSNAFPEHTKELITHLLKDLSITQQPYNFSLLEQVDSAVINLDDPIRFEMEHYLNFIAIIGEVLRSEGVDWKMTHDKDADVWEPSINYNGRQNQFFGFLWEDIYQSQDPKKPICTEIYLTMKDILRIGSCNSLKDMLGL